MISAAADGLNLLIGFLQATQLGLLRLLAWLGLTDTSNGQPAWPWALRLSGENLLIDLGQARRTALTLLVLAAVVVALVLALLWRRGRIGLIVLVPLLLAIAPWPEAAVVLVPSTPTSFHRSPTGFSAASITQGQGLYAQHCASCHGADGRGQGALAATQPVWPPNLTGPLLWRRADGDVLWHVLHGMTDRQGTSTMPAFGSVLNTADAWALIDFMKAQGAGQTLQAEGVWAQPIALPDMTVRCDGKPPRLLSSWRGQRVRIVTANAAPLLEDPRLITVLVQPEADIASPQPVACVAASSTAWTAFALIAGTDRLAGTQLLADRDGWLRARGEPGKAGWSDDDLLCRTDITPRLTASKAPADGLGALIARMDAEPVRFVKGGFVH